MYQPPATTGPLTAEPRDGPRRPADGRVGAIATGLDGDRAPIPGADQSAQPVRPGRRRLHGARQEPAEHAPRQPVPLSVERCRTLQPAERSGCDRRSKALHTHYYGNLGPKGAQSEGRRLPGQWPDRRAARRLRHAGDAPQGPGRADRFDQRRHVQHDPGGRSLAARRRRFRGWARGATLPNRVAAGSCKNFVQQLNRGDPQRFNDGFFGSHHPQGANLLFCDGHVQFLAEATELALLLSLSSRNGHEAANPPP